MSPLEQAVDAVFEAIEEGAAVVLLVVTPEVRKQMLEGTYDPDRADRARVAQRDAEAGGVHFAVEVDDSVPDPGWRLVVS